MNAIYPLFEFYSDLIPPLKIAKGIEIVQNKIDLAKVEKTNISVEDDVHIRGTRYCLQIDKAVMLPEMASLLFMISCRILKRTKVFIRFRVEVDDRIIRVIDHYPFVTSKNVTHVIWRKELKTLPVLFSKLRRFRAINRRAKNAFYFLSLAYRSRGALESLLFHVFALETLTSSSEREGKIKEKFANRINFITGYSKNKLQKIYDIRSELTHGRYSYSSEKKNLKWNRIAEEVCRKVFNKILLDSTCLNSFKNDKSRMALFGGF